MCNDAGVTGLCRPGDYLSEMQNSRYIHAPPTRKAVARRRGEFVFFYLIGPVAVAVLAPTRVMFPALFAFTAVGLVLLGVTPGFHWHELTRGWRRVEVGATLAVALAALVAGLAVLLALRPDALFALPLQHPRLMVLIAVLYPIFSALPQEIVFRVLYFQRYGGVLPQGRAGLVLNAAAFSLAHLMFWNAVAVAMAFAGGLIFAWAYSERRSFATAVAMHSLAGVILFALGLGTYFYTGNVVRPF